jgi:hypothetical protein
MASQHYKLDHLTASIFDHQTDIAHQRLEEPPVGSDTCSFRVGIDRASTMHTAYVVHLLASHSAEWRTHSAVVKQDKEVEAHSCRKENVEAGYGIKAAETVG